MFKVTYNYEANLTITFDNLLSTTVNATLDEAVTMAKDIMIAHDFNQADISDSETLANLATIDFHMTII